MDQEQVVYVIDGERIQNTDDFYAALGEAVNGPGGNFGTGLDSLNDCLRGGFGTPEDDRFMFLWTNSGRSRSVLGYPETVHQLERRLARCHPTDRLRVREELAAAARGEGPTVFDWIVGIFEDRHVQLDLL